MTASPVSCTRCEPGDLLSLLTPGQVIGLYQGTRWIDWGGVGLPGLEILTSDRPERFWRARPQGFHFVIDSSASQNLAALLDCLASVSRGVALVSSRLGTLLQRTCRVVAQPGYSQRTSGPFRSRTSGALLIFRETTLRVVERAQVLESATLSLRATDPAHAVGVLEPSFPGLQLDRGILHLTLRGYHAEEVLGRLRQERIAVTGSAVWYRLLQTCPLRLRD
jgi:hypothetical protein